MGTIPTTGVASVVAVVPLLAAVVASLVVVVVVAASCAGAVSHGPGFICRRLTCVLVCCMQLQCNSHSSEIRRGSTFGLPAWCLQWPKRLPQRQLSKHLTAYLRY
jgi:hypothetical protein